MLTRRGRNFSDVDILKVGGSRLVWSGLVLIGGRNSAKVLFLV